MIACPTMRSDGSLLVKQGYDPATRLLLIEPPAMPPIPDHPTRGDALRALKLLEELVCESPFVNEASKSVALSGLITPVVRGAMPVVPMHASSAPTAGTGKSFLWDLAAAISIGQRRIPVIAAGNEEETEKRLVSVLLTGQPLISIDNVNRESQRRISGAGHRAAVSRPPAAWSVQNRQDRGRQYDDLLPPATTSLLPGISGGARSSPGSTPGSKTRSCVSSSTTRSSPSSMIAASTLPHV